MNKIDLIIDALEKAKDGWQCFDEYEKALAAARELRAMKPEQELVSHLWECIGRWSSYLAVNGTQANMAPPNWLLDAIKAATAQPEQERNFCQRCGKRLVDGHIHTCTPPAQVALNKSTSTKPWVGLTDEEITDLWENNDTDWESINRVEAKLKEKNT